MRAMIVVPAYNESRRLPNLVAGIEAYLASPAPRHAGVEVTFAIVDDGSRQDDYGVTERLVKASEARDAIRLVRCPTNRGKGAALRTGFDLALAEGCDYVGFIDADGAVPVPEMHRALAHLVSARNAGLAGVIGSRVKMLGRTVNRNRLRHGLGRLFATFVTAWFGQPIYDSQCGLKIFERGAILRHLDMAEDTRWVWDTELLLSMLHAGERIDELPIDWSESGHSHVSLVRDPVRMIWRLLRLRRRLRARRR